ncbi:oxidoreductase [Cohnella kolymensis]|uniref:Oxidoreductase n=1 Tax=Cohnella kolymensis TaxID=1590652 RepID=A0ABR5A4T6_9BACL|nr:PhzF family phenazine biosynthesis protein [Cohnella kolymensis]KIL35658.1 oxidoreductase [Cohnella kolymensis]
MPSNLAIYTVDAFTNEAFKGNPAGVCMVEGAVSEEWMQNVGAEMNLAETALLHKVDGYYSLRWFTPQAEVDLCGHATLASAHILWTEGYDSAAELRFMTKSGVLTASRSGDWIVLDFPLERDNACEAPGFLEEALGVPLKYVGRNRMDYIVEVENQEVVKSLKPKMELLRRLEGRGVIVTSRANDKAVDFVSRCFFPGVGIDEDPVTGSAHCCLGPYWQKRLHKDEFSALQISKRGGVLKLKIEGERIRISGQAVTTLKGRLIS